MGPGDVDRKDARIGSPLEWIHLVLGDPLAGSPGPRASHDDSEG